MRIRLDPASRIPESEQLRAAIEARVRSGRLAPGRRLPPVRSLAAELGLAPNTVAKAYRELQSAGYLVGRGRYGTYVADALPGTPARVQAALDQAARSFALRVSRLGVPTGAALAAARRALGPR